MEKQEREELLREVEFWLSGVSGPVAKVRDKLRTLFDDYDALEERLEGMTLSSEAAHTYAVELEAKLAEAEKDRERLKREVARLNDDVFSMSLIGAAREGE